MSKLVEDLLRDNGIAFIPSGKDYLIKCLNPNHEDTHPSCRVDQSNGVTHCLSCGWKRNLFKHFGVFTNNTSLKIVNLKKKIEDLKAVHQDLELPKGSTPYTEKFRGISRETLKHFGAFYTHEVEKLQDRIIFPIKDLVGRTVVFVARHTMSDAQPRYVNYPSSVTMPVYPELLEVLSTNIVLVEGIFDMINLYDNGMRNAICVFGTNTLKSNMSRKLLPFKVQGVTKVFIAFDGDTPGREAAKELKPLIEEQGFQVEIIDLPDGVDPGSMDIDDIHAMKEYTK